MRPTRYRVGTMKLWWRVVLSGILFLATAHSGRSQGSLDWRLYKVDDGMHQSACLSVTVAANGKIVALHRNRSFVTELDGYSVKSITLPQPVDGAAESPGGQFWASVPSGWLVESKPEVWTVRPVPEFASATNAPPPFQPLRWGQVLFLQPDRLLAFKADIPEHSQTQVLLRDDQTRLGKFTDMAAARDGGLWITGERGLGKMPKLTGDLRLEGAWADYLPPETARLQNLRAPLADEAGVTVIAESAADAQAVVAHFDGQAWAAQPAGLEAVQRAWRSSDGALWVAAAEALFRQAPGQSDLAEYQGISARRYYDVAMEPGGTFWLATSSGLFHYAPPLWRTPLPLQPLNSLVRGFAEDAAGRLWFVAAGRLHSFQGETHRDYALPEAVARDPQSVRAFFPLRDGTLLLDLDKSSIRFNPAAGAFTAGFATRSEARQSKALGLLPNGNLCLQSWSPGAAAGELAVCRFDEYDGARYQPLADPPPEAVYATLFAAHNGDLWMSGDRGVAWYHEKKWRVFPMAAQAIPEPVLGFAELSDGRIWCATQDKLWEFDGRSWLSAHAGFDHINAVHCARDGSVWVADDAGTHRFFQKTWIANSHEEGLPDATVHKIFEDQSGRIWAATPHGVSRFHPEADPDPPRTLIQKTADAETRLREGDTLTITFSGQDKWKFTPRERLLYAYKLDYRDWSPFTELHAVSFSDLPDGRHICQVRAMDRNGNVEPKPVQVEFAVLVPWYREVRLVSIACVGAVAALFFAGLAFNRHWRLRRSHAEVEKKVAERTRELEIASQELLQSQKMKALGTLAAGIAHDFNNILSIIQGSAQIIEENTDNPQKIRVRVDRIKTMVDQGAGIVNAMLGFSSGAGEQPGLGDLNFVARDTLMLLGDRFLREVEIRFEPAANLPVIYASKNFIQQILLNFIFNAAEAMIARKQVVLTTQRLEPLPAGLVLAPAPAAAYVAVSVRDFGCGIPPENLPRIFEPFYTTKALSARRGTGLGLSMVYELAKKMEAGLAVESAVGQGSTFTLILPVQDPPPEAKNENQHRTSNIER
jgi:signal transduction histidine kinase/ligand-binding sensor domain-containing protein